MYINGVYVNMNSAPSPLQPTYFYLGKSLNAGDAGFIGSITEFRIWRGILTPSQITTHYQEGAGEWLYELCECELIVLLLLLLL